MSDESQKPSRSEQLLTIDKRAKERATETASTARKLYLELGETPAAQLLEAHRLLDLTFENTKLLDQATRVAYLEEIFVALRYLTHGLSLGDGVDIMERQKRIVENAPTDTRLSNGIITAIKD